MVWQDLVFAVGTWIFIIAFIPILRSKEKPPISTSVPTGIVLLVYSLTFMTLDLWLSVISSSALGILWLYAGWQKHKQKEKR